MPKMTHPESTKILDVATDRVALYESQGWTLAASKKS